MNVLVVGAGLSGAVIARELAERGCDVTVVDRREHVAGNAHDFLNEAGIRVHKYGPHLFHTSNPAVVDWVRGFADWIPYRHRVQALLRGGEHVTLPVNRRTAEKVGRENVLDVFFRPYSRKMWNMELEDLDPEILKRVPVRDDDNEFYFPDDTFQALPAGGYTGFVSRVLAHDRIRVILSERYVPGDERGFDFTFSSMSIDEYFSYDLGRLPYRSIRFHTHTIPVPRVLPVATVNFTHDGPFTRVTEWNHLPGHGGSEAFTTLTVEEPCSDEDNGYERYYPVKDVLGTNRALYRRYAERVPANIEFVGRCGLYAYLDMHQAISAALHAAKAFAARNGLAPKTALRA